jgi:WhiB family redox-sensing transcriptional regulator
MGWRERAACLDEDPELFFPPGRNGPALAQTAHAKTVCGRCLVIAECLKWAMATGQDAGVWGGLSADERRSVSLMRRRAQVAGTTPPARPRE